MRLTLVVPGFAESDTDLCIPAVSGLCRALAARHEVHVVALRHPKRRPRYVAHGAEVTALAATGRGLGRLALLARGVHAVSATRPEIVHALWADEPGAVAVAAAHLLGRRAVVSVAGGELVAMRELGYGGSLSRTNRALLSLALRGAAAVTAGSLQLTEALRQRGVAARTLPLGVAPEAFSPPAGDPLDGPRPRLLQVGSLTPVKDVATTLRALVTVRAAHPAARLHLVGDGPERPRLAELARELSLGDAVCFHGEVPHAGLGAYYAAADLLVVSSRHESQSLVVLEAAALGLPAIGTAVGLLPELVPAELLAAPGNATQLGARLTALLADNPGRRALKKGLHAAAGRRSLAACTAAFEALYEELLLGDSPDPLISRSPRSP